jgi:DNA-directed RNA polymerase subunit H (RpoH/RPB5)
LNFNLPKKYFSKIELQKHKMEYQYAYEKIDQYAKQHNLELEFGFYSTKIKNPDYLDKNKSISEINISTFILTKFSGDIYICILREEGAHDTSKLKNILNLCGNFSELLLVVSDTQNTKLISICTDHRPKMNLIHISTFIHGPLNHYSAPKEVRLIDYEAEQDIVMCEKNNLMEIHFHDPLCAWFRFKPGDVILILNRSFISGFNTHYRVVK